MKKVWDYVDDPLHLLEIWPSMVEVRDVKTLPKGGHRYHWLYKMAGMRFEGDSETVVFEPERRFVQKNTGQIPSTFDWTFTSVNGTTKIELKTEYEIPQTLRGKLKEPFVRKLDEREADIFLANLMYRVEI